MAQDKMIHSGRGAYAPTDDSAFRWESRSSDELMDIIGRGLQGGDLFDAARIEMERRAAEAQQVTETVEAAENAGEMKLKILAIGAVVAVAAAAALLAVLL